MRIIYVSIILPIMLLATFLTSCKKEYKFEVYAETGMFSNLADTKISEDVIKETNDSIAFTKAHRKFLILMDVKFANNKNFHPEIHYFKLLTKDGHDISSGSFLQSPNKLMKHNADICLSDTLKEYLKNLPIE